MKQNKNKFAVQAEEWVELRNKVKVILTTKRTVGLATQAIMCLLQDEIVKAKKELVK